jgi:hypothetical protein
MSILGRANYSAQVIRNKYIRVSAEIEGFYGLAIMQDVDLPDSVDVVSQMHRIADGINLGEPSHEGKSLMDQAGLDLLADINFTMQRINNLSRAWSKRDIETGNDSPPEPKGYPYK